MDLRVTGNLDRQEIRPVGRKIGQAPDPVQAFGDLLRDKLGQVNELEKESRSQMEALASGRATNVHDVMIALEKSKIALEYTSAVRNKVVEAYKEIMRTQL